MTKSPHFCSKIKFHFIDMYLVSLINCITFYLFSSCWHYWLYQLHCFTRWDTQKWFLSAIHLPMVIHIGLDIDCPLFARIWNFCGACQSLFWQCVSKWQVQLLFHVSWVDWFPATLDISFAVITVHKPLWPQSLKSSPNSLRTHLYGTALTFFFLLVTSIFLPLCTIRIFLKAIVEFCMNKIFKK